MWWMMYTALGQDSRLEVKQNEWEGRVDVLAQLQVLNRLDSTWIWDQVEGRSKHKHSNKSGNKKVKRKLDGCWSAR